MNNTGNSNTDPGSYPPAQPSGVDEDALGAFLPHAPYSLAGYEPSPFAGALSGLSVGIKDLYDVAGFKTGAGSPAWLAQAVPAKMTAPSAQALLQAGAHFVGKTLTDELAWSLNGENVHDGTPINVAAPGRIPGGSSAGSAAAVAGGLCSVALGSDTGGSVRLPASYCGIWGIRPTHGRTDLSGAVALAPSFDTAGWFARTAHDMQTVGTVLLDENSEPHVPDRLILATDGFERVDAAHRDALIAKANAVAVRLGLPVETRQLADPALFADGLTGWRGAFRIVQSSEAWQVHGAWVEASDPPFGPGIKDRFLAARDLRADEIERAKEVRAGIARHLHSLCRPGTLVMLPGAAGVAPLCGLAGPVLDDIRNRALEILCPAGLAGLPQLVFPALTTDDGPIGLSFMGWRGGDEALLALAAKLKGLGDDDQT